MSASPTTFMRGCSKEGLPVNRAKDYLFGTSLYCLARVCPRRVPLLLHKELTRSLLVPQRNHWVYFRAPPRRNVASQQRCPNEEQCHPTESQRISGSHAKE